MKPLNQQCVDIFKLLEMNSGIYDLKIKGIPVWWFIRFRFYQELHDFLALKEKKDFYFNNKPVSTISTFKKNYKGFFLFLLRSITGFFLFLKAKKKKVLFLVYSQDKKKLENGLKANFFIEKIVKKMTKESVILEQMSFNEASIIPENNLIFFDGIILISFFKNIFNFFSKLKIENWGKFENNCRKINFGSVSSEWIIKTIEEFIFLNRNKILLQVSAAQTIIDKLKPKLIVENTFYNSGTMALNYIAKKNSIPVIEVQHGLINEFHLGYIYFLPENQENIILPDKIFVYSDFFKEVILKSSNAFSFENIKVTGSLRLNDFVKKYHKQKNSIKKEIRKKVGIKDNDFLITLTSDSYSSDFILDFLWKSMPLIKDNIKLCIKLHPMDNKKNEIKKYKKIIDNFDIKILTDDMIDLYHLLISSDLNVTIYSTVFLECLSLDVPNVIIDIDNNFDTLFPGIDCLKKIIKTTEPVDFSRKINKLAKDNDFMNDYKEEFKDLSNYFFDTRKDSEKIIIEEIK